MLDRRHHGLASPRTLALATVFALMSGCAQVGIRPDTPTLSLFSPCEDLKRTVVYAQDLQESYHSRASMNRFSIYVAGILGLGTAAATGGLGAAGAAALTLALLSISGGFASGSFVVMNNEALSLSYTTAANEINVGLEKSLANFDPTAICKGDKCPEVNRDDDVSKMDPAQCRKALTRLNCSVTKAKNNLETARTDNVAGAAQRAKEQIANLEKVIAATKKTEKAGDDSDTDTTTKTETETETKTTIETDTETTTEKKTEIKTEKKTESDPKKAPVDECDKQEDDGAAPK